jgi:hypothetical protein
MSVDVALQMLDDHQYVVSEVTGNQARSHTELEGQKLNERDRLLYDMVQDLVTGLSKEIDPNIRATFGPYVVLK